MTYTGYQVPPPAPAAGPRKSSPALPILGAVLLVASLVVGLLLLTAMGTVSRSDRINDFGRFVVEGGTTADVDIKKTGEYTIYYEFAGEVDGDEIDADDREPDDLAVTVTDDRDDEVRVRPISGSQNEFEAGDRRGVEVATVEFEEKGDYVITATGSSDEPFAVSIGRGSLADDLSNSGNKLLGLIVLIVGGLAGVLLLVLGLAKRSKGGGPPQPTYGQPQPSYGQQPSYGGYDPNAGWRGQPTQQQPAQPQQPPQQPQPPPQSPWPGQGGAGGWGAPPPPNQPGSPNPPFPGP